jgi:hypothetical protein
MPVVSAPILAFYPAPRALSEPSQVSHLTSAGNYSGWHLMRAGAWRAHARLDMLLLC